MMMTTMKNTVSYSMCRVVVSVLLLCVLLQEGYGLPLSGQPAQPAQTPQPHHVRTKRCSCNSWLDKECIYFCHLDIIWVNTPSKLLPYGLGSKFSRRRRRSADRCECAERSNTSCSRFCQKSSESPELVVARPSETKTSNDYKNKNHKSKLLASLRSMVRSNMAVTHRARPGAKRLSRDKRLRN